MKIKLGVIFGGETVEHEVSIITALQAIEHINTDKYDVVPIYISKDRIWYTGDMLKEIDIYKDFKDLKKYAKEYYPKAKIIVKKDLSERDRYLFIINK